MRNIQIGIYMAEIMSHLDTKSDRIRDLCAYPVGQRPTDGCDAWVEIRPLSRIPGITGSGDDNPVGTGPD